MEVIISMYYSVYHDTPGEEQINGPLVDSEPNLQDKNSVSGLQHAVLSPEMI